MRLVITISLNNAAFEDNGPSNEVADIMKKAIGALPLDEKLDDDLTINLYDSYGNRVGEAALAK